MDRETDRWRQTDRQTPNSFIAAMCGRQMMEHTDRDRQTDRETDRQTPDSFIAAMCGRQMMEHTDRDRQTDRETGRDTGRQTPDSFINPAAHIMRAVSVSVSRAHLITPI